MTSLVPGPVRRALHGVGRMLGLDAVTTCAFLALFVTWGVQIVDLYEAQQKTGPDWGHARIGFSDASMWERGGLRFFFGLGAESNLYRPTVGMFFASMIALWGSTEGIAIIPPVIAAVVLLATYFSFSPRDRPLILLFLAIMVCSFSGLFGSTRISVGTLMTEPTAWTFALVAYLLITNGIRGDRIAMPTALVGFMALGVVAAIRGLHLAGGLLVYLGVCLWFFKRERLGRLVALLFVFLAPVALDGVLQKAYGIHNNAYELLATFTKPPHTYDDANRFAYIRLHAPGTVALKMLAGFMIKGDGPSVLLKFMAESAEAHLRAVSTAVLVVLVALTTRLTPPGLRASRKTLALTAAHLLVLAAVSTLAEVNRWLVLLWVCVMFLVAVLRRMPFTFVASGVYLGCLAMHVCTCSAGGTRPASTFVFLLYFAAVAFAWEASQDGRAPVEASPMKVVAGIAGVALASLYLGFVVIRFRTVQRTFKREVAGRNAAMKIADDQQKRSLYLDGQGETFFALWDSRPVGGVFRYSKIIRSPVPDWIKQDPGFEPFGITFLTSDQKSFELVP